MSPRLRPGECHLEGWQREALKSLLQGSCDPLGDYPDVNSIVNASQLCALDGVALSAILLEGKV